jgi:hypothetical protein
MYDETKVYYKNLRPAAENGEYPYLKYDDGNLNNEEKFRIIYYPKRDYIEIFVHGIIETKWPGRVWPKMQPILDSQKRESEVIDKSFLVPLGGGLCHSKKYVIINRKV